MEHPFEKELSETPRSHEIELMRDEFSKFLHSVRNGEGVELSELAIRTEIDETTITVTAKNGHVVTTHPRGAEAAVIAETDAYLYAKLFHQ